MKILPVFYIEGDAIGTHPFSDSPLVGDCFMQTFAVPEAGIEHGEHLVYVRSRRFANEGALQLIVGFKSGK